MKIVIAPDSFKGSLTAWEAAQAMARGVLKARPVADVTIVPMADGGEGTLECLVQATKGQILSVQAKDPLGREIESAIGILGDGTTCVVEMAKAAGLYLLTEEERNPLQTSTYGVGELVKAGLGRGCRKFIIGLGGSATNDGGAGFLQALGVRFTDQKGRVLDFSNTSEKTGGGGLLSNIHCIHTENLDPRLTESTFLIACDVDNHFIGPQGASHIFGPQKGATPDTVLQLDANLHHFANLIQQQTGHSIHHTPGAGAAGGLAGALLSFLNGTLQSGVKLVIQATRLEHHIGTADLILTGEGRLDAQTAHGKTPSGVARLAQQHGIPCIALAGSLGDGFEALYDQGLTAAFSIVNRPMTLNEAIRTTNLLVASATEQIVRVFSR